MRRIDLTGQRYGRLVVLGRARTLPSGQSLWTCRCDCGAERLVYPANLRWGRTRSCGCLRAEQPGPGRTHGGSKTLEYKVWSGMLKRARQRGYAICARWQDFASFLADVGLRPSPRHVFTRSPDTHGVFEPANAGWIAREVFNRQRQHGRTYTHDGRTQTIMQWARELGISRQAIVQRLAQWPQDRALSAACSFPIEQQQRQRRAARRRREFRVDLGAIAEQLGLREASMRARVNRIGLERATTEPRHRYVCTACGGVGHNRRTCKGARPKEPSMKLPMPPPSAEFLTELTERCRELGWSVDYIEIENMLKEFYKQAGTKPPNLEPYDPVYGSDHHTVLGYEERGSQTKTIVASSVTVCSTTLCSQCGESLGTGPTCSVCLSVPPDLT